MRGPTPIPDPEALRTSAHRYAVLAAVLAETGVRTGRMSREIAADWPDEHGREWAERTDRLRRHLHREALAAAELGQALTREAEAREMANPQRVPAVGWGGGGAPARRGMRLGGTEAQREDDDRGVRIAELPAAGGGPTGRSAAEDGPTELGAGGDDSSELPVAGDGPTELAAADGPGG